MNTEIKVCKNCQQSFTIEPDDFAFYEKMQVPPPTWCPECRLKRRFAQRNERSLYKRKCDLCEENIIAMYSSNKPYKVYCPKCWHSDNWDSLTYGRDYDPSRSFFDQLKELQIAVPHLSLLQENAVNSPWINYETDDKNCYLNFGGHLNEDCAYNHYNLKTKDCLDNFWLMRGEYCYENILCENCYRTSHSILSFDCRDTIASFDCRNCSNVIGCSGLRHKQYHIFNEPVSKAEYDIFVGENLGGSYTRSRELLKKSKEFWKIRPQRAVFIEKSVNVSGHLIYESKNTQEALSIERTENSKYVVYTLDTKDSYDTTSVWKSELCYELIGAMGASNIKFITGCLGNSSDLEYSHLLFNCQNCFGCINMKKKQYCILNKQYNREKYESLREKIKIQMTNDKEYGEFFPPSFSPYGYNETIANEWFPMKKEEAIKRGWNWEDVASETKYEFSDYQIPDKISDVKDDILDKVLKCEATGKAYRIIPMELAFYRRFNIPIPREAPFARHRRRLGFISGHRKLIDRACGSCDDTIKSVYLEEEFPNVYCEPCYQREIL